METKHHKRRTSTVSHPVHCVTLERHKEIICNWGWRFLWQFYRLQLLKSQGRRMMMMGLDWWKVIMEPFPFLKPIKQAGFCMGAGNESRQELRTNHTEKRCLPSWMLPSSCSWMAETHTHTHGETEHAERFASCATFSVFAFAALDPPISLSSPQLFSLPVFRNRSISTVYSVTLQAVFIPRHKSLLSPTDYFTNTHK